MDPTTGSDCAIQVSDEDDTCWGLASWDDSAASMATSLGPTSAPTGISFTFSNGSNNYCPTYRQTTYKMMCSGSSGDPPSVAEVNGVGSCQYEVTWNTPLACVGA